MRKLNIMLCSAVLSVAALATTSAAFAEGETASADPQATATEAVPAVTADAPPAVQTPESQNSPASPDAASADNAPANPADPYEVKTFFADFTRFTLGDVVPDLYRSKKYIVSDWKTRHLPEPQAGSHWTYMGGNYVLIGDADGKIQSAKSGEIFYKQ